MKRLFFLILMITIVFVSCNKEEAIEPSADFTTNLENNTLVRGKGFTVYLDNVGGEFKVYFRGHTEATTYDPADPRRKGTDISNATDSVVVTGYPAAGEYVFTLVASSSGNWAEDYVQDVKSITITVVNPTK